MAKRKSVVVERISQATTLVEKMASNQGWSEERTQTHKRGGGMHQLKEVDMLATKMDLLMKRLDERTIKKKKVMHIHDSGMTCEECGEIGHTGTNYLDLTKDVNYMNNNNYYYYYYYRPEQNQGWNQQQRSNYSRNYQGNNSYNNTNQPPLRELVLNYGK